MMRDTEAAIDDEPAGSASLIEIRFGQNCFRVGNVSERVQLASLGGLFVTAITALLVHAHTATRSPRAADEEAQLS